MRKFICSNFELDLSKLKITDNMENPWFSDKFFAKVSFPFEMDLSEENDINFGFLSHYNANSHTLMYEGKYVHRDQMEDAILEIEEVTDKISLILSYGYDEFPNFKKKLAELPLDKFEVEDIYEHAETIIPQTWPAVNYNFPQIHIDKIDNSEDPWLSFEKIINNYKEGAFLINEVDVEDVTHNRNIIQPVVHALHILKKGFEDAGKILKGDILTDPDILKLWFYTDTDYWTTMEQESYSILKMSEDFVEDSTMIVEGTFPGPFSWSDPVVNPSVRFMRYLENVVITSPGKYRIIGQIKLISSKYFTAWIKIKYRNQVIFSYNWFFVGVYNKNIDIVFETLSDLDTNDIVVEVFNGPSADKVIIDLNINPIRLHDDSGEAIPTIINQNQVDLTRAVPDMTFGDYVNTIKNWFNVDLDPRGSEIYMNYVQKEMKNKPVFDMRPFEVKQPVRKFTKGSSFVLKFQDVESKEYQWPQMYQSATQSLTSDFKTDERTNEIIVNALPLPITLRAGVQTAHAFDSDKSRLYAIVYDGLTEGLNLSKNPHSIQIPQIYERLWKEWLTFRINSQGFQWSFIAFYEDIMALDYKGRALAYLNNCVVKTISRSEVSEDLFEIDIEIEAEL